jgi:putative SbcD/Mre11-related phosphoesterase
MNRLVELAPGKYAHASGALWLAESRTALVADVHLGYGWALRRRGQLGPVIDGGVRERLEAVVEELKPERLIFLGDLVHAPRPAPPEREMVEATLKGLQERAELTLVTGNHDRGFGDDYGELGLRLLPLWESDELVAVHGDGDIPETAKLMAIGHYHPALGIRDHAGVKQKAPLFLASARLFVLPAFSPFAAGIDVTRGMPAALRKLFARQEVAGVVVTGRRAVSIGRVWG